MSSIRAFRKIDFSSLSRVSKQSHRCLAARHCVLARSVYGSFSGERGKIAAIPMDRSLGFNLDLVCCYSFNWQPSSTFAAVNGFPEYCSESVFCDLAVADPRLQASRLLLAVRSAAYNGHLEPSALSRSLQPPAISLIETPISGTPLSPVAFPASAKIFRKEVFDREKEDWE